jgi:selenium-binding protein 1
MCLQPFLRNSIANWAAVAMLLACTRPAFSGNDNRGGRDDDGLPKTLYVWSGSQVANVSAFLAVVDFDEDSPNYGEVIKTVSVPPPYDLGNEPHHCHLSADKNILGCGGLLSVLKGQDGIFFFDVSSPRDPKYLFSTSARHSSITDDFLPLEHGGFLVSQMGSETGGEPGRIAEFDSQLRLMNEWPEVPPQDGFNPHGISARPEINLMVTSDFILPVSTLDVYAGDPVLRGSIRVWDFKQRKMLRTVEIPGAPGTMDVKLIPHDPKARAITAGMFDGLVYLVDTRNGTAQVVFDCENIVPHIEADVRGGMTQLLTMPASGDRLIFASFEAGQVGMLDISDPEHPVQSGIVNLGVDAGPHNLVLTDDDKRLVVTDYFLNEDDFGKIHFEGDHKVHVIKVSRHGLKLDTRFNLDFNTAFAFGPARPHGMAMK